MHGIVCEYGNAEDMRTGATCPRCQNTSAVGVEVLFKADRTEREYECRACAHKWKEATTEKVAPPSAKPD